VLLNLTPLISKGMLATDAKGWDLDSASTSHSMLPFKTMHQLNYISMFIYIYNIFTISKANYIEFQGTHLHFYKLLRSLGTESMTLALQALQRSIV